MESNIWKREGFQGKLSDINLFLVQLYYFWLVRYLAPCRSVSISPVNRPETPSPNPNHPSPQPGPRKNRPPSNSLLPTCPPTASSAVCRLPLPEWWVRLVGVWWVRRRVVWWGRWLETRRGVGTPAAVAVGTPTLSWWTPTSSPPGTRITQI